jgi:microcystin-dependent protein
MRKTLLASTSAIVLLAGTSLALAQGAGREAPSPAPGAQQSAPAEKIAPGGSMQQRAPESGTTGQGSPRMEQDRPQGAQAPSGTQGQDRMKSGDPKASDSKAGDSKSGDAKSKADQRAGDKQNATTGQGAAGAAKLSSEQRTKITTSIKKTNVRPVTNVNFNISVGTVVPRSVTLHALPPTIVEVYPAWRGYRFVLVADEIIIIEPSTYRIVAVIDA